MLLPSVKCLITFNFWKVKHLGPRCNEKNTLVTDEIQFHNLHEISIIAGESYLCETRKSPASRLISFRCDEFNDNSLPTLKYWLLKSNLDVLFFQNEQQLCLLHRRRIQVRDKL